MNKENQEKITLTGGARSRILKSRLVPQPLNVLKYATSNCRVSIRIVLCIIIIPDSYTYMCVNTRSYMIHPVGTEANENLWHLKTLFGVAK